jgi:hypothetical protein
MQVPHDTAMANGAAGHGNGMQAVEFVANALAFGPGEKRNLSPGFLERAVHG